VTFLARGPHLAALRRNGLKITSPRGNLYIPQIKTAETIREIEIADLVLVGVKLWDTESVAASLKPIAERGAAIISFQNGVHKDDVLRKYAPADSVLGGVCYVAAAISEPGVIGHTGTMQRLVSGVTLPIRSRGISSCQEPGAVGHGRLVGRRGDVGRAGDSRRHATCKFPGGQPSSGSRLQQQMGWD
jgi:ketopantoate reductase